MRKNSILLFEFIIKIGIINTEGQIWRDQRRFSLRTLRDFGMGKQALHKEITDEMEILINEIDASNGEPFDIHPVLMASVCNLIFGIVFGKRFNHNDPTLTNHLKHFGIIIETSTIITLVIPVLPFLRYFPGDPLRYWETLKSINILHNFTDGEIERHKETYEPDTTRDLVDAYLHVMKEDKCRETTFSGMYASFIR